MRVQVRVVFHRFDNVVHRSVPFVVQILVLLILPGWPAGGLLYPRFPEIVRGSLISPRATDMGPCNRC